MEIPSEIGREFTDLFGRYEYVLKRRGFLRQNRNDAQADWRAFAAVLGEKFFTEVRNRKLAETLIEKPPARLMREGLAWQRPDHPLRNSVDLFELGICRVRNSLFHGEKFIGSADQIGRDIVLVKEAFAVLCAARDKVPGEPFV